MNRKLSLYLFTLILIVVVLVIVKIWNGDSSLPILEQVSNQQKKDRETANAPYLTDNTSPVVSKTRRIPEESQVEERLRRELEVTQSELDQISRPLHEEMLSSTVNASIRPGETLVTGGYMTADGRYEMTFLTPKIITQDGNERVELKSQVISIDGEFAKTHGMETLATNARNTLQHAEAWEQSDATKIITAARNDGGATLTSSPSITSALGQPFEISMGASGGIRYSLGGSVDLSPDGNFAVRVRIENAAESE